MNGLAQRQRREHTVDMQTTLFKDDPRVEVPPFKSPLLKWIGSKQRVAHEIVSYFPEDFGRYFEPFVGSGAVLATLSPRAALASDTFAPLIDIWQTLAADPGTLVRWYTTRYKRFMSGERTAEYERIKAAYNKSPNGADFLFLCRSCYAGVVRFRQSDGYMSTPCGPHTPISPEVFAKRAKEWRRRVHGASFAHLDYREAMARAREGDLVYCDPPYKHSQAILYGAQQFRLTELFNCIETCKKRGVRIALSIDGTKRSGNMMCDLPIPEGLFAREVLINCGRSMLRRLQMSGRTLEGEVVADRLLLTY